ncbi:hypothetical protein BGZ79_005891 [Entomortierella chlamydospora]|nr:hypothetical protein BGZ79_005891 [Entomortierella chlamydospora]
MSSMTREFGVSKNSTSHTTVSSEVDVEKLLKALRDNSSLDHVPDVQVKPMVDLFALGTTKLFQPKRLDDFRARNSVDGEDGLNGVDEGDDFDEYIGSTEMNVEDFEGLR